MSILFKNITAVLMDESNTVLDNVYVLVKDRKIAFVGSEEPTGEYKEVIDGDGKVLMPGLINTHTHTPMIPMRGYGDGNNLQDWLHKYIFPIEAKWDAKSLKIASDLGICEMIASGTTTINDMYMDCMPIAQAVADSGINANLVNGAVFIGTDFSQEACPMCQDQYDLYDKWHNFDDGRIKVEAGIHAEYTSIPELHQWIANYAKERGTKVHVHVSETEHEHQECIRKYGMTPTQLLNKAGVFDNGAIAAHCVYTTPEDWRIFVEKGVSVSHNPCSNLKLGSGVAPILKMKEAGVNVTIGTDGVSSNNTTDMFEDMRIAAMLQTGINRDPLAISAADILRMSTVNGAKALGRNTGRIAEGCDADLVMVDFDRPNLMTRHDVISNLVYAAHGSDVVLNMCQGQIIYRDGKHLTIDVEQVKRELHEYVIPHLFG